MRRHYLIPAGLLALAVSISIVARVSGIDSFPLAQLGYAVIIFGGAAIALWCAVRLVSPGSKVTAKSLAPRPAETVFGMPGSHEAYGPLDLRKDFEALLETVVVRLPLESHRALEHVELKLSDARWGSAYGLYAREPRSRGPFVERVVVFRDTIVEDCGHDYMLVAERLRRTLVRALAVRDSFAQDDRTRLRFAISRGDLSNTIGRRSSSD